MSRVYQKQPPSTVRRPPGAPAPPLRPSRPNPVTSTTRGARAPSRGRALPSQAPRQERYDDNASDEEHRTSQQERTTHIGDGFHMIRPSGVKRDQIQRQAENEQRQYEAHVERNRLRGLHEVHRLGGYGLSEEEVRQRQADQYRRDKFTRSEKVHQDQMQKKEEEEKALQAKKQAARLQAIENEKRDRSNQLRSMRSNVPSSEQGASGWTDKAREDDRRKTMDRFLNRVAQQYDNVHISSDEDEQPHGSSNSAKLSILRGALPHIDSDTLERYLEIYNGNVDVIVDELSR